MLNEQNKKRIILYEQQCNKLQTEVNVLRSAIDKLTLLPTDNPLDLNKHFLELKSVLKDKSIQQRVASLVDVMSNLSQQRSDNKILITDFIEQGARLLGQMLIELKDKNAFERMEQLLKEDADERKLIKQFSELLGECVAKVVNQIEYCEANHKFLDDEFVLLSEQINYILSQLLDYLPLPPAFVEQQQALKTKLNTQIAEKELPSVLLEVRKFIVGVFNFEQNYLRGLSLEFDKHLRDFSKYLKTLENNYAESNKIMDDLEQEIGGHIQEIKSQIDHGSMVDKLAKNLVNGLKKIGSNIKQYKESVHLSQKKHKQATENLQDKLMIGRHKIQELEDILSLEKIERYKDGLTGLPNKISYDKHIQEAYNRWRRGFGDLSIMLMDIDNFKIINDTYGHLVGDKVLKELANLLKSSIRAVDFIARFAGDEFIFIFERTHQQNAFKVGEGLRCLVELYNSDYFDHKMNLTASFGLTSLKHGESLQDLFHRADKAMEAAKCQGCNCIVIA